jgi:hypothetical protein
VGEIRNAYSIFTTETSYRAAIQEMMIKKFSNSLLIKILQAYQDYIPWWTLGSGNGQTLVSTATVR